MNKNSYPKIPILCLCGCNEIVYGGKKYLGGHYYHNEEIRKKMRKSHPSIYGDKNPAKRPEVRAKISKNRTKIRHTEESKKKISETIKMGFTNGRIPWNKGKIGVYSSETLEKISKSKRGKTSWWKGKKRPDLCGNNNPSCRPEVRKIKSEKLRGEKNGSWKGGVSYLPYCQKFNNKKREEVRELYGRKCFACGKSQLENITKSSGKQIKLSVHHIDMDKEQGCNGKDWKLIPLCIDCHENFHWQKLSLILKEYHEIPN